MIDFPESLPPGEMEKTLRELRLVNRWLGGAAAVLRPAQRELLRLRRTVPLAQRPLRVLDVGAGGADIAVRLARWAQDRGLALQIVAVDFNPEACAVAARFLQAQHPPAGDGPAPPPAPAPPTESPSGDRRQAAGRSRTGRTGPDCSLGRVEVVVGNVLNLPFPPASFDLVLCSTFLHHFEDDAATQVLRSLRQVARQIVLVNDLHRNPLAYWSFRLISRLFSRSQAVKHDGPVSILRGFRRRELHSAFSRAGFAEVAVSWRWAFRWSAVGSLTGKNSDTSDSAMR